MWKNEANVLKNEGVKIVTVGIGNNVDYGQLERVATFSTQLLRVTGFGTLQATVATVINFCMSINNSVR